MADLLSIGTSGINIYRRSLATTGNNIANVDTEGYSRQTHETQQAIGPSEGTINLGTGVLSDSVRRAYDAYATSAYRNSTSLLQQQDTLYTYARKLEDILADQNMSMSSSIDRFFAAAQDLSVSPSSTSMRENLLNEAVAVIERFKSLSMQFDRLDDDSFVESKVRADELNSLSTQLARVNELMLGKSDAELQANGLMDQRDKLLQDMSELATIKVEELKSGRVKVYLGSSTSGHLLVDEEKSKELLVTRIENNPEKLSYTVDPYGSPKNLSSVPGGKISGIDDFRNNALKKARDELDGMALAFMNAINEVQISGLDAAGNEGRAMFGLANENARSAGQLKLLISDGDSIATGSPLMINQNGSASQLKLTNWKTSEVSLRVGELSINDVLGYGNSSGSGSPVSVTSSYVIPGHYAKDLSLEFDGNVEIFTRDGAHIFGSANQGALVSTANGFNGGPATYDATYLNQTGIASYRDAISFSTDVTGVTTLNVDGQIGEDLIVIVNGGASTMSGNWFAEDQNLTRAQLESELEITFTSASSYSLVDVTTSTVLATRDYQSGDEIAINGWTAVLNNAPVSGDKFTVSKNTSPRGDNRNILSLLSLQNDRDVFDGRGNFSEVYADVINDLGSVVVQSSIAKDAQLVLTDEANQARDSVSAVALDEEAADLLRFQQAYQANAQIIQAANKIFDWIVNIR